jgi:predicted nuclease with RNAse H fold
MNKCEIAGCHPGTVAGVDVGGEKKGFHAVALRHAKIFAKLTTHSAAALVAWCRDHQASVVGIDAPCQWRATGQARACERELVRLGISALFTPNRAIGESHPFYRWMVNGAALFRLLAPHYRLYDGGSPAVQPLCFETFPQAIASALAGKTLSAKNKRVDRRRLLTNAGIATDSLTTIDEIDAALCAFAAQHVLRGRFNTYGDAVEGFILVPSRP